MILDKRILKGKTYLDCFDTEIAKQFIGKKCYFTRDLSRFKNLDGPGVYKVILTDISDHYEVCYGSEEIGIQQWDYARYIIPCEWVKGTEPKYRPYEFSDEFSFDTGKEVGDVITIRLRTGESGPIHSMILARTDKLVTLGYGGNHTMEDLLKYDFFSPTGWTPLGMKCEE